jgi:hypothetical protein
MKVNIVFLALLLWTSGCSWVGNAAKEGLIQAAGYPSWAHFTLEGQVPADYSFQYTAYYQPDTPTACTFFSPGLGGQVPRKHIEQERTDTGKKSQDFRYRIPLAYHEAGCEMRLSYVGFQVFANYGPGDSEFGRDLGSLGIHDELPDSVPHLPVDGTLEIRGQCMWLFRLIGKGNHLVKILVCHKADEQWHVPEDYDRRRGVGAAVRRDELDGRTVRVEFRQSQEERPLYRGTWVKTEGGWKPCLGKGVDDPYGFCRGNTEDFKPFQMNGHKCMVYPNCTE